MTLCKLISLYGYNDSNNNSNNSIDAMQVSEWVSERTVSSVAPISVAVKCFNCCSSTSPFLLVLLFLLPCVNTIVLECSNKVTGNPIFYLRLIRLFLFRNIVPNMLDSKHHSGREGETGEYETGSFAYLLLTGCCCAVG